MKWPDWFAADRSSDDEPLHKPTDLADSIEMDAVELAAFVKAATELILALEAFTKVSERLYPLLSRAHKRRPSD